MEGGRGGGGRERYQPEVDVAKIVGKGWERDRNTNREKERCMRLTGRLLELQGERKGERGKDRERETYIRVKERWLELQARQKRERERERERERGKRDPSG